MMESMIHQWRAHFELVCTEKKINIKHKQRIEHKNRLVNHRIWRHTSKTYKNIEQKIYSKLYLNFI